MKWYSKTIFLLKLKVNQSKNFHGISYIIQHKFHLRKGRLLLPLSSVHMEEMKKKMEFNTLEKEDR